MKAIFFNKDNQLRNGWWIMIFIILTALTSLVYTPISKGLQQLGFKVEWLGFLSVMFILLVSWICTRLMKKPLSSIGLSINRRWFTLLAVGILLGGLGVLLTVTLIWSVGGVTFSINPAINGAMIALGIYMVATTALYEELLFRGFLFQRLMKGIGVFAAQGLLAILFAVGHWGNPGMDGVTQWIASIDLALAAILFGLAYIRTQSLALPIGLHFGWNWFLGQVMGFGVSGIEQQSILTASTLSTPNWLTGGSFGPEGSIFAVIVDLLFVFILWRWKHWGLKPALTNDLSTPDSELPKPVL
ncbi:CPBP family intramembrane glutamic endopeptidase [Pleionea mediterranea]|uniref:CAAX prenyl protease 2/Lysostaphin resistance protein A-like domain-containing protein n=1 Tax=Pleionea mediterranea TaxID=523701 RepID=A0A316G1Q1_9GAMM|nr:type II CAAX endopeptidase family protein [Pleionea mediterranea]PWK53826.1 hypothetical protein C8D97_102216 [Pleionea mediterranea]